MTRQIYYSKLAKEASANKPPLSDLEFALVAETMVIVFLLAMLLS